MLKNNIIPYYKFKRAGIIKKNKEIIDYSINSLIGDGSYNKSLLQNTKKLIKFKMEEMEEEYIDEAPKIYKMGNKDLIYIIDDLIESMISIYLLKRLNETDKTNTNIIDCSVLFPFYDEMTLFGIVFNEEFGYKNEFYIKKPYLSTFYNDPKYTQLNDSEKYGLYINSFLQELIPKVYYGLEDMATIITVGNTILQSKEIKTLMEINEREFLNKLQQDENIYEICINEIYENEFEEKMEKTLNSIQRDFEEYILEKSKEGPISVFISSGKGLLDIENITFKINEIVDDSWTKW